MFQIDSPKCGNFRSIACVTESTDDRTNTSDSFMRERPLNESIVKSPTDRMSSTLTAALTGILKMLAESSAKKCMIGKILTICSSESLISFNFVDYSPICLCGISDRRPRIIFHNTIHRVHDPIDR
jgi:hypothetical protein